MRRIEELLRWLDSLPVAETQAAALSEAGETLLAAVQEVLSVPPGGPHEAPWLRTGALREGIGFVVRDDEVVVGSGDPVAADQERGTPTVPARPFLAPVGAAVGARVAEEIGARFAALLHPES